MLSCLCSLLPVGCSQLQDPNVPEPIRSFKDPEFGREYLLYRPSRYDRKNSWPLVVVCHSSFPDSPVKQIKAWTELAEAHEFIVVAPTLRATKKSPPRQAAEQIQLQREDEDVILRVVQHIRGSHTISDDRIFIHGFAGGARTALHTGLRHSELFRAISLIQPLFKSGHLTDVERIVDPYQPVHVNYSLDDVITGKNATRCLEWLRAHQADLREDPSGRGRRTDTASSVQFFEDVIRKEPWIRIHTYSPRAGNPLEIQFKLRCPYTPLACHWTFGDEEGSTAVEPVHTYARYGTYDVEVTITGPEDRTERRSIRLTVP